MKLETTVLTKGITLHSITTNKFKTGTLSFAVRFEDSFLSAPYALILCELLRSTCAAYPTKIEFSRRLDDLYSASVGLRCISIGENKIFTFNAEMLDNAYATDDIDVADGMCDMLTSIMLSPVLDEDGCFVGEVFEQEKRRVISYLRSTVNNPARYAQGRLIDLYRRDKNDHTNLDAKIKVIESCTREDITKFYRKYIASNTVDVFYVGSLSNAEIGERIMRHLGTAISEKAEAPSVKRLFARERKDEYDIAEAHETMPISQARLAMGFCTGVSANDEDFYALVMANEIFGGSAPSSKLFMNVRERMSLCYSCYSSYDLGCGRMIVSAGIDAANGTLAREAILSELEDVKNGRISEKEFSAAKKTIENSYREIYDDPYGMISYYLNRLPTEMRDSIDECREKFSRVTLEDVVKVAQNIKLDCVYFLSGDGHSEAYEEDGE